MMKTIAQQLNVKEFPFEIKDNNGKTIYSESSIGYWWKREFDSAGNVIYSEDSTGSWWKKEYDSNGNEIYSEDSDGNWIKREFDSAKNQIYYEDSNGMLVDNRSIPEYTMEELVAKLGNFKIKKV